MATTASGRDELRKVAVRAVALSEQPAAGSSSQPEADEWTPDEGLRPPLDLELLSALTITAPLRRSCIAAITLNTVGLGHELKPRKGREDEGKTDDGDDLATALDRMANRDERLGRPDFTRLLSAWQWDRQEVGTGYVEVSRNKLTGEIDGLYHAPGKRIRRKADRTGYVMGRKGGRGSELTHFYEFGSKVVYDADGRPTAKLAAGATRWDRNELLPLRMYTSQSRDYGLPPDAQLAIDYRGDKLAAQTNVGYFDHSGVPPTVFFVQGRESTDAAGEIELEIDPTTLRAISDTLRTGGGTSRVAVVPVPAGTQVTREDLAALSDRDVGFVNYRSDNRRRTLGAWRLSPIFVADIEDAGKYTAEVERAITKEQVFDPEQREIAGILNSTLVAELAPHLQIVFNEIEIKGDDARRQSANDLAAEGKITNGEYRAAHGYAPMPERGENEVEPTVPDGKVPAGWNNELIGVGAGPATPIPEANPITKLGGREFAAEIEEQFDRAMDDAVRSVQAMADGAELHPVVIEKTADGQILVRPYANGNGAGS